ncbi:hypothetical protein SAMN05421686_1225 [Thalassolituus maritimus]|uniref:Uncharacterized protein n=1 Tax=Thalassolituus maritimus TaxID=484498 RepID=A0A1N7QCY2_9GAMM|nr:hypothetical protein [Thalassolituus maritimus]SIT20664.1 hypothetical protein SAMN05421686_1225 [Thalassolituus maritimus]
MNHQDLGVSHAVFLAYLNGSLPSERQVVLSQRHAAYDRSRHVTTVSDVIHRLAERRQVANYQLALILGVSLSNLKKWRKGAPVSRQTRFTLQRLLASDIEWDELISYAETDND